MKANALPSPCSGGTHTTTTSRRTPHQVEADITEHPNLSGVFATNLSQRAGEHCMRNSFSSCKVKVATFDATAADHALKSNTIHLSISQVHLPLGQDGVEQAFFELRLSCNR